jgi:hypothetical protein
VTGFEVYKMYLALKNHFNKSEYDYFRYHGKVRANETSFLKRKDVYFFKKLGTKYSSNEMLYYLVSNFIVDVKGYHRNFSDDVYKLWKTKQESFSYKFKQDVENLLDQVESPYDKNFDTLFIVEKTKHPSLLRNFYAGEVALETMAVFEHCLGYIKNFNEHLTDPVWQDTRMKIIKYIPFLDIECSRYKKIILETIRNKL